MMGQWQAQGTEATRSINKLCVNSTTLLLLLNTFIIVVVFRYFQCQPKYGLFAPVHKVTRIGFPSTTPAKAKTTVRKVVATPAGLKRSPSASSISTMSSVASSVSAKPSRTGLVRHTYKKNKEQQQCITCGIMVRDTQQYEHGTCLFFYS